MIHEMYNSEHPFCEIIIKFIHYPLIRFSKFNNFFSIESVCYFLILLCTEKNEINPFGQKKRYM